MIRALQAATGDAVVVATVPTLEPYGDIDDYAVKLFENHGRGIGEKGKDNGALILLALKERRVRIEVGYDLEQWITDGFAGETSRESWRRVPRRAITARASRRRRAPHRPDRSGARRHARGRAAAAEPARAAAAADSVWRHRPDLHRHPRSSAASAAAGGRRRATGAAAVERLVERRRPVRRRLGRRRRRRRGSAAALADSAAAAAAAAAAAGAGRR